ncbi:MAG: SDR family oxidoreductase [Opitutaceae bacterium]|nr:SDR family oxidoreductase [Opitutaceae bacterium]
MKGPVVLVTGASQGIGAEVARLFAREVRGARLALVARNGRNLSAVARACARAGAEAEVFRCDVADAGQVEALRRAVTARFGAVDVLVNNAGRFAGGPFLRLTVADFDAQVAANLRSVFLVSRAFVPGMARRRRGDVFNLSSIAGLQAYPNGAAYCAAKFGVTGLTQVMRAELRDRGVRVCAVHPGATWTPSWHGSGFRPERMMPAGDIARAILAAYRLDRRTVVEEIVLRPQRGDV